MRCSGDAHSGQKLGRIKWYLHESRIRCTVDKWAGSAEAGRTLPDSEDKEDKEDKAVTRTGSAPIAVFVAVMMTACGGKTTVGDRDGGTGDGGTTDGGNVDAAGPDAGPAVLGDLTGPWQLFVDSYLVDASDNVVRTYHPFEKDSQNPVLTATEPWEGTKIYLYGTVLPNESGTGYRMWHKNLVLPHESWDFMIRTLYTESTDGVHWTKPDLGFHLWMGSTDNNIFYTRIAANDLTSVIHTPWDPDPNRAYKFINHVREPLSGYHVGWSPDALNVTDAPQNPVLTAGGDVGHFIWDPHQQLYVGYVKVRHPGGNDSTDRRSVARTESADLINWTAPQPVLWPDPFDDRIESEGPHHAHMYGMPVFPYQTMYLGLLWIFRATDPTFDNNGPSHVELVSSRDGFNWKREDGNRPRLLDHGLPGGWDAGQVYTSKHPVLIGARLWLYYGGCDNEHNVDLNNMVCSIGRASLRKDGFVSMDAGAVSGTITTKKLSNCSGRLRINYNAVSGWLAVEVQDENGNVIQGYSQADCDPLTGDSLDQPVTWSTLTELPTTTEPIRLRFTLQNASLYSFTAGPSVRVVQ